LWRGFATLVFGGAVLAAWGFVIEPGLLRTTKVEVASDRLPAKMQPLRIAVISDLHVGSPWNGLERIDTVIRRINAFNPDIVLLLGDYVVHGVLFGQFVPPETTAQRLRGLKARHGVYAVLGNHDWWLDGKRIRRVFEAAGIRVLDNEAVAVPLPGGPVWLAGIADDTTRNPDPARTLQAVPEGEPVVMFAHDPAIFPDVPRRVAITLAGHTHGGQVYLPWVGALITPGRAPRRHAYGLIHEDGKTMFVTAGLGTSIIPVRFNMPPEIALITLIPRITDNGP
jgi:predicted MPP superfamily phosphohydrolase